jgi:hypothetical protein
MMAGDQPPLAKRLAARSASRALRKSWPSSRLKRWEAAKKTCPGMDKGKLVPVEEVRIQRDTFKI